MTAGGERSFVALRMTVRGREILPCTQDDRKGERESFNYVLKASVDSQRI